MLFGSFLLEGPVIMCQNTLGGPRVGLDPFESYALVCMDSPVQNIPVSRA